MSVGYAVTNLLSGLAATAFTWSSGYTTGRDRLNDDEQDELASGSSSAQASGQYLQFDMGAATYIGGIALLNHNCGVDDFSVEVTAADNAGFTVGVVTAKAATAFDFETIYSKDTILQFPAVLKRYWRLTFTYSGTKTITIGEVLAFESITELSRNITYGNGESERYVLNRVESRTGHTRSTYLGGPIRTLRFGFKDLQGTTQRDAVMQIWRSTQGGNKRLLWVDYIESTASAASSSTALHCIWGRLSETHGWTGPDYNLFDVDGFELVGEGREVGA